jgi:archaellum biogenesis protein FlaJ (TadC family)
VIWIIPILPLVFITAMYYYPSSEAKSMGEKINQELPFVTIYMAAISSSGISPVNMFEILLKSGEYENTNKEIRKLMNLVNFQGYDLVTALRKSAASSASYNIREII